MLKTLLIKNFQAHKNTTLEFAEGVNLITGASDNGKSSIVRALRWVIENRPSGTAYRTYNTADDTEVCLTTKEGYTVARMRGNKTNCYEVGTETYQALRTDVPTEVSTPLSIADCSIQGQHDPYFLLQASPGDVAKKLSEFADLGIIQSTIANSNRIVKGRKDICGLLVVNAQKLRDDTCVRATQIEELAPIIEDMREKVAEVVKLPAMVVQAEELLSSWNNKTQRIQYLSQRCPVLKEALQVAQTLEPLKTKMQQVHALIGERNALINKQSSLVDVPTAKTYREQLRKTAEAYKAMVADGHRLAKLVADAMGIKTRIADINTRIEGMMGQREEYIAMNPACPTCGKLYS